MTHIKNSTLIFSILMTLILSFGGLVPQAAAESSMLMELNNQLNQETQQVKSSINLLKESSAHQQTAAKWASKANSLPKESKDFAYARAQYTKSVASDLEQKFETVTQIYHASSAMVNTIEQLTAAQKRSGKNKKTLFNKSDSAAVIQAKAKQLKGLNDMFVSLIHADPSMQSRKLRQAYRVSKVQWGNTKLQASIRRGQGISALQNLKDSSESISYLAKAYLNGLKYQADITQIVSIGGEANLVNSQAEKVMADAFDALNPDGQAMMDMQMMLNSIEESQSATSYDIGGDPSISNEIDSLASRLISERK